MNRIIRNCFVVNSSSNKPPLTHRDLLEKIQSLRREVRSIKKLLKKKYQDSSHLSNYKLSFGRWLGWPLKDIPRHYLQWFAEQDEMNQKATYQDWLIVWKYLEATE